MPNSGQARVVFDGAVVEVFVTDEDVRQWMALGHQDEDQWGILKDIAYEKARGLGADGATVSVESPTVLDDGISWDALKGRQSEGSRRQADSNPATKQASDCLKIAKTLANLLNELAGLDQTSREQIAQAAGLQQLPEALDRLYELADQVRMGGVQNLQTAYATGWDPDKLKKKA